MASFQILLPEKFNFTQPEQWPRWYCQFERFRQVSGLASKSEENQANTLIYSMGEEAGDILYLLGLSDDEQKKYDTVLNKFEVYFVKRRNPIYKRAKFNMRRQEKGESVDSFIMSLYCLAEHCNYHDLHDKMICDRIVVGLRDSSLSERLQTDPELILDKAITVARRTEAVREQQPVVRGEIDNSRTRIEALEYSHANKKSSRDNIPRKQMRNVPSQQGFK